MRRCIKCGKEGEFRLFCPDCYRREHPILRGIKTTEIRICPSCNHLFQNNKWKPAKNIEAAISDALIPKLDINREYKPNELKIKTDTSEIKPKPGLRLFAEATLNISAHTEENNCTVVEEYILPITLDFTPCGKCNLGGTQYFEGIMQVRNIKEEMIPKIQEIVEKEKEAGVHINDIVNVKENAVDFYITDVHYMKKLGKELQRRLGGELSMSPRLQTRDNLTSKDLYRLNVLLRLSDVRPGDYVEHEKRVIKIKKSGPVIIGRDIMDNTNIKIDPKKFSPKPLEIHKTTITKVRPQIEVMNPLNYQSAKLENARKQKLGQKVRVVIASEKLFLIN